MSLPKIEEVKQAVERLHNCTASHMEDVVVVEKYGPETVWEGIVHVFRIQGHEKSDKCYAWASPIKGSKKYRYYAVLHIPPVDSPQKAVRASIVKDYKNGKFNSFRA